MKRWIIVLLVLGAFGLGAGVGTVGLLWATGGNAEPSRDTSEVVPTLSLDTAPTIAPDALVTQMAALSAKVDSVAAQIEALSTTVADNPAANSSSPQEATPQAEMTEAPAPESANTGGRVLFRILEEGSEARFYIDEILLGNPTTVIGTTSRVAGDIIVDFDNPAASQVGAIAVNVRTLRTDQEFRDQSIRGQILQTSTQGNEFVTFTPAQLVGLVQSPVAAGDTLEFQIAGELMIKGMTRPATFDASVTWAGGDRLEGVVRTEIAYDDYGITINLPPQVGGVGETVILELEFVAEQVEA